MKDTADRNMNELDGPWKFLPDLTRRGEELGCWKADHDDTAWLEISVPSTFDGACSGLEFYEGICWYRTRFCTPDSWKGRRIAIHFGTVSFRCRVWLNDQLLGENRDGCLPFEFEIQDILSDTGENILSVEVDICRLQEPTVTHLARMHTPARWMPNMRLFRDRISAVRQSDAGRITPGLIKTTAFAKSASALSVSSPAIDRSWLPIGPHASSSPRKQTKFCAQTAVVLMPGRGQST